MFDFLLKRFRWFRALRGGIWYRLDLPQCNGGTEYWTQSVAPDWERYIVEREFYSPFEAEDFHDGYHTVHELYTHRHHLYCLVLGSRPDAWKSRQHHDGPSYPGWFLAGCSLDGKTVTYHLPNDLWDLCPAQVIERGLPWDGHTSNDVISRMKSHLRHRDDGLTQSEL
jgi:hypothetical protein